MRPSRATPQTVSPVARKPPIAAAVFDLDDTLYPEREYVRSGYDAAGRRLREQTGRQDPFEQWLWDRFQAGRISGAFDELNSHFALGFSADQIASLVSAYREHVPDIRPYEGISDLLAGLRGSYRLGLLSDGFLPAQRLKLEAIQLAGFFDAVVFTEEMGRDAWKPSAAGYEAIRRRLDVPHERCAYVADNPAKDFAAPNHLGWRTIQYLRPGQIHAANPPCEAGRPQLIVRTDDELREVLHRP